MIKDGLAYHYSQAIHCLVEIDTDSCRKLLPAGLYPVEINTGLSLLSIVGFQFIETPVGPYTEIVAGILTQPFLSDLQDIPKSAVAVINVGTSTQISRAHAIERYELPHFESDIFVDFESHHGSKTMRVMDDKSEFLKISVVTDDPKKRFNEYHQVFGRRENRISISRVDFEGVIADNQQGRGRIKMAEHPFLKRLDITSASPFLYSERYSIDGKETMYLAKTFK